MTSGIISNFDDFSFDGLSLAQPHAVQGGTYFTRLTYNGNSLYIQTPKCSTKQGMTRTEHKIYTDLMFSQYEEGFIHWLEKLESKLQGLIYEKRRRWFHNELELEDIESAFTSLTRSYRSGKNCLVRCNLGKNINTGLKQDIKIFNESEEDLKLDDIKPSDSLITILDISGIRFSSRSFHVDLYVKQLMVFQNDSPFKSCLIRQPIKNDSEKTEESVKSRDVVDTLHDETRQSDEETISNLSEIDSNEDSEEDEDDEVLSESKSETHLSKPTVAVESVSDKIESAPPSGSRESNMLDQTKDTPSVAERESLGDIHQDSLNKEPSKDDDGKENTAKDLEEVELSFEAVEDEIKLRDPNEVYMQIYMEARQKAKLAKKAAIEAYLEAKKIKNTYLLEEIDDSDEEDISTFSEK